MKKKSTKPKAAKPRRTTNTLAPVLERMDRLEGEMSELKGGMNELTGRMDKQEGRMDKLDGRMDKLDGRMSVVENTLDTFRQETALEFKKSREETAQEFEKIRREIKEGNENLRSEVRDIIFKYYLEAKDENKRIADENDRKTSRMLTMLDGIVKELETARHDRIVMSAELDQHDSGIKELQQKDAEKETAIQDLQKRVAVLENARDGKPPVPEPSVKD